MHEWYEWASGDCVYAPDRPGAEVAQAEILRRVAVGFRRVVIDWPEGERWAEARAAAAEDGYRGFLLEAEHALRAESVLVSVADAAGPDAVCVRFYLTADTGLLEFNYQPAAAVEASRALAHKLAEILGYEFSPWDGGLDAELGVAPDCGGM